MTLSEEFQAFLKEPGLKIEEVRSVEAQIISKEMQFLRLPKRDRKFRKPLSFSPHN